MNGEILGVHKFRSVNLVMILTKFETMAGNTRYYVASYKPNTELHLKQMFNSLEDAQTQYDREVTIDG